MGKQQGSIFAAIIWMFVISVLLFWAPFLGPLIAGIVGGKKAGGVGSAILAVFLPALIFAGLLFFFASALTGLPVIGAVAGAGGIILAVSEVGPLLLGAVIGGIMA